MPNQLIDKLTINCSYFLLSIVLFISIIGNSAAYASSLSDSILKNNVILPGYLPEQSCQISNTTVNTKIVNASGFVKSQEVYFSHRLSEDYTLLLGRFATMTYILQNGSPSFLNENNTMFFHDGGKTDHNGLDVRFSPGIQMNNGDYETTITFHTSQNTLQGTYWISLPPNPCEGGSIILLHVGDVTYLNQPSSFTATIDKHIYSNNDRPTIEITGTPYDLLNLQILNASHQSIVNKTIMIDPSESSDFFPFIGNYYAGTYDVTISNTNMTQTLSFQVESTQNFIANDTSISSPLKQIQSGISPSSIKCNTGFRLIYKSEDSSPVCVTPNTANILIERGWGHLP